MVVCVPAIEAECANVGDVNEPAGRADANAVPGRWDEAINARLDDIRSGGRWRQVTDLAGAGAHTSDADGNRLINFAANDYLGLASDPRLAKAAFVTADAVGSGAGSARLITGGRSIHRELEERLAAWKGTEAAVLFPTGYMANVGVLTALAAATQSPACIYSDSLNHASIIDGVRLSRAERVLFPHGDIDGLRTFRSSRSCPGIIVSDSIFSMDGDVAPLAGLSQVANEFGDVLVLDEAHQVFQVAEPVANSSTVVRVGTLSKALGSMGGFVACSRSIADLLINTARSFIFTTGSAPGVASAALCALDIVTSEEGTERLDHLRRLVDRIRPGHPSPIIPIVIGDEGAAVEASTTLRHAGLLVPAIRPPTVAPGTSRLRVTLSFDHTLDDVDRLMETLDTLGISW